MTSTSTLAGQFWRGLVVCLITSGFWIGILRLHHLGHDNPRRDIEDRRGILVVPKEYHDAAAGTITGVPALGVAEEPESTLRGVTVGDYTVLRADTDGYVLARCVK